MIRLILLSAAVLMLAACTSSPIPQSAQSEYGPTTRRNSPQGYLLSNRQLGVSIDGFSGAARLYRLGSDSDFDAADVIIPKFARVDPCLPVQGYVEARDDESWQYIGQSGDGRLGWRIVYTLDVDALNVSYIVQNKSDALLVGYVVLPAVQHTMLQPFNEDNNLNAPAADGSIRSDEHTLKPGERISFTTRWTLR